jgi:hypothetical protein
VIKKEVRGDARLELFTFFLDYLFIIDGMHLDVDSLYAETVRDACARALIAALLLKHVRGTLVGF